ncbi:penicillin-binding protein activator [Bombella sp. TMW 2.2559]|uniref:Penicillin-binding protein activator n=1 Tax=Bombella dulcis TaxID=2967339 RepID=A0ABT3W9R4_9PROT|nr:penicillin-binding protein activator [Bombella dulcis]MCX5615837.1 penicillin-binding protein activator [Bombella dulcis]
MMTPQVSAPAPVEKPARVGLIVPLSGPHAAIGQRMRDAARLALPETQAPPMDIFDSAQPDGPAHAAQQALDAGDRIVLGPLTTGDTQAISSVLQPAGVPELAFTSDGTQARPGVWVMGLTPEQQVRRLVDAARLDGRKRFAAFLPDTALGHSMGEGLTLACQEAGLEVPQVVFHSSDIDDITQKMAQLSRRPVSPSVPPSQAAGDGPSAADPMAENDDAGGTATQTDAQGQSSGNGASGDAASPPPFDALLLGDTGLELARVIAALKNDQVLVPQVRILGPMLWRSFDGKLGDLRGAWYVAFDEKQRSGYVQSYQNVYHQRPSPVADFAYDAAALAGALIRQNKLDVATLTQPKGYVGVNGLFHLRSDGRLIRALAIYQIAPGGGSQMIVPASRDLTSSVSLSTLSPVSGRGVSSTTAVGSSDVAVWSPARHVRSAAVKSPVPAVP